MYDITIIGSGIVGATTALALAQTTPLKIALLSQETNKADAQQRVSAIGLASQRVWQNLEVWESIATHGVSPYTHMTVWDKGSTGAIHFDCAEVKEAALGYIMEDAKIRHALLERVTSLGNIDMIAPVQLQGLTKHSDHILLNTTTNSIATRLVCGADGAQSWLRTELALPLSQKDYQHVAIVATVKTSLTHQATAWQRFLPTGPLAFLPLSDPNTCSIVWSVTPEYAKELLASTDSAFCQALSTAFEYRLGKVQSCSTRYSFPLIRRHVKQYCQERVALLGDAAHTIHPLAGQGVNLGILDAACLAEIISDAVAKRRDFTRLATLRRYERWRKADTQIMLSFIDGIKHLFGSTLSPLVALRGMGLNLLDRTALIKNCFIRYAVGDRHDLPGLAK